MKFNSFATVGKKLYIVGNVADGIATVRTAKGKEEKINSAELVPITDSKQAELVMQTFAEKGMEIPWFVSLAAPNVPVSAIAEIPVKEEITEETKEEEEEITEKKEEKMTAEIVKIPRGKPRYEKITHEAIQEIRAEITSHFSSLVGQYKIIFSRVEEWVNFATGKGNPPSGIFTGEAGLGKTALMRCDRNAAIAAITIRGDGAKIMKMKSTSQLRKASSADWKQFVNILTNPGDGPAFFFFDELHELFPKGQSETIQAGAFVRIVKQLLDKENGAWRECVISENDGIAARHANSICFVLGTNFPSQVKDFQAFTSRCSLMALDLYTKAELKEIALRMAQEAKLILQNDVLDTLSRAGRGTARPIEKIMEKARTVANNALKNTVSKQDVLTIMAIADRYPSGLTKKEVMVLNMAGKQVLRRTGLHKTLGVDAKILDEGIVYMSNCGFLAADGSKIYASKDGKDYIKAIRAAKFTVEEPENDNSFSL
jgi:Holliday junction resolvasome RuvABC ATP-dependent DNA helicase subunit